VNVALLLAALENYRAVIGDVHTAVREAHLELDAAYRALRDSYDGEGAEEFHAAWQRSGDAIGAYTEGVPPLVELLEEKVEQLRALDRGVG